MQLKNSSHCPSPELLRGTWMASLLWSDPLYPILVSAARQLFLKCQCATSLPGSSPLSGSPLRIKPKLCTLILAALASASSSSFVSHYALPKRHSSHENSSFTKPCFVSPLSVLFPVSLMSLLLEGLPQPPKVWVRCPLRTCYHSTFCFNHQDLLHAIYSLLT